MHAPAHQVEPSLTHEYQEGNIDPVEEVPSILPYCVLLTSSNFSVCLCIKKDKKRILGEMTQ